MLNLPLLFFLNIFVNMGGLGNLSLTFELKNDTLGKSLMGK